LRKNKKKPHACRFPEYAGNPSVSFFLWLRGLTGQKLIDLHRHHLGTQMRDASQEVSLYRGALPRASSISLANQLLGRLTFREDVQGSQGIPCSETREHLEHLDNLDNLPTP